MDIIAYNPYAHPDRDREGRGRSHTTAVRQALMALRGEQPPGLLNPAVWSNSIART